MRAEIQGFNALKALAHSTTIAANERRTTPSVNPGHDAWVYIDVVDNSGDIAHDVDVFAPFTTGEGRVNSCT